MKALTLLLAAAVVALSVTPASADAPAVQLGPKAASSRTSPAGVAKWGPAPIIVTAHRAKAQRPGELPVSAPVA